MFLRGDVRPAQQTVTRTYTREQVREGIRLPSRERPYFTPGFPLELPLRHASRIASFDGPATGGFTREDATPLRTDTGELTWSVGAPATGLVTVDTERSQAVVGFVGASRPRLKNFSVETRTPFCAITLSALDDQPVARANRLLVTATARMANSEMVWNAKRDSLEKRGSAPTRIEPVVATLRLRRLEDARVVMVAPLDGAGRTTAEPSSAARTEDGWQVELNAPVTSYLITIRR